MSKRTEKALNEKLNVKLPENLSKENILEQLENSYQDEKIIEIPKKKNTAKKLIPIAASFAVIIGLLSAYFGMGMGKNMNGPSSSVDASNSDKTEVVRYQSYDKIYAQFDELHKEYEKDGFRDIVYNIFNYGAELLVTDEDEAVAEDMAGDMNSGSLDDSASALPESAPEADGSTSTANKSYGNTNTQENGVDEGDIIKTDGSYLYVSNVGGETVSIVDITNEEMKISAAIRVDSKKIIKELYIRENNLVIVGGKYDIKPDVYAYSDDGRVYYGGYNDVDTFVQIYDITDRTAPKLVTEYSQQGEYGSSRMIGEKLYTVSTYYVDISADNYRDYCIPEAEINGVCEKISADCISVIEESEASTYAVITTLDVASDTEPECEAILGDCDELYATSKGLFISETDYDEKTYEEITKIYRFEYTDKGVSFKCMGKVAGYINDQFSMSYDGEYFRIATTLNKTEVSAESADDMAISSSTSNRVNNLYILNNNMQIVGKVEDLAQGETIKSVRFVGNMAYVVTFRQTDPLFVIDLTDPQKPTVKGELKIPGFSEYLHPITENLLVGVGYDGNEFGTNGDCKVSLFDVSNPYEPKESSVLTVSDGKAACDSLTANNHKLYIKLSENEFAVPFIVYSYVESGDYLKNNNYVCYIRYKLAGDKLCEVARYTVQGTDIGINGATYVENTFYAVVNKYNTKNDIDTYIVAFDLNSNEEIGRIQTAGE